MKRATAPTQGLHRPGRDIATLLRIVIGIIWIAGAAFNATVTWRMTDPYGWLSDGAGLAAWRWFFREVVDKQPDVWTAMLVAGEVCLGLFMLGRGRWARIGMVGGALFSATLVSFATPYTVIMGPYALLLIWLARQDAQHSLLDLVQARHRPASPRI